LSEHKPLISVPVVSAANNLLMFVSWPVWSKTGDYLGYVGGSIYLKKKSILNALLDKQFYRDGSSLYVVDSGNRVLYHQDQNLIGKKIKPIMSEPPSRKNGFLQMGEENEGSMLVGYATVSSFWLDDCGDETDQCDISTFKQVVIAGTETFCSFCFADITAGTDSGEADCFAAMATGA